MIAICDHFEPFHGDDMDRANIKLQRWNEQYPPLVSQFKGSDEVSPKHTFFYPVENYNKSVLDRLKPVCEATNSEVEIHLHHENDTPENLYLTLLEGKDRLRSHGFLGEDPKGEIRYGFIHGNWALNNSHPAGKWCGVNNELRVLNETGCYADFTMPSAPHRAQTPIINSIYYAEGNDQPCSHFSGTLAQVGKRYSWTSNTMLCVQGPLGLNWERRKWVCLPRIENGDLEKTNPPTPDRLRMWLRTAVNVQGRPEWCFAKLHTHGARTRNMDHLLGRPFKKFLQYAIDYCDMHGIGLHFVTAREMVNIIHAAEDGQTGDPHKYRNYRYQVPPLLRKKVATEATSAE